jgi:SAM-dependent methyltransferase
MDLESVAAEFEKLPTYYGKDGSAFSPAIRTAISAVDNLLSIASESERNNYWSSVIDQLHQDPTSFTAISRRGPIPQDYADFFADHVGKVVDTGGIHLELGSSVAFDNPRAQQFRTNEGLAEFIRLDLDREAMSDICASCTALPFAANSIDRITSNSLFEHIPAPEETLRETFRVLRPGGVMVVHVPFHFVEHRFPKDYLRYTGQYFEDVCAEIGFQDIAIDTKSCSGLYSTLHSLSKAALVNHDLDSNAPRESRAALDLHVFVMCLLYALKGFDHLFHAHAQSHWHTTHCIAVKPGEFAPQKRSQNDTRPFVERIVDILRCPETMEPLRIDGTNLITSSEGKAWPIINGKPDLSTFDGFFSYRRLLREYRTL